MAIRFARSARGRAAARALSLAVLLVLPAAWLVGCEEANEAPVASFTAAPGAGHRSLEVAFDATASSDADGEIAGYSWNFGDGGTATGAEASHAYAAAGAYTATLTVTDDRGATHATSQTVTVVAPEAVAAAAQTEATESAVAPTERIAFPSRHLVFNIERDYDQRLAVPIENRSGERLRVVVGTGPMGSDLIGGFVGEGSRRQPLDLGPGANATLTLSLFAQDATRRSYRFDITARDADSDDVLSTAAVSVLVRRPKLALNIDVGDAEPGTLARTVTIVNEGETLTDLTAEAGEGLAGEVFFAPRVEHANLPAGGKISFAVHPRLSTIFTKLEGSIVLHAAGQRQTVPLAFALPLGKHVFVATGFSNTNDEADGKYCTNKPNIDTSLGGPGSGTESAPPPAGSDSSTSPVGGVAGRADGFWDGVSNFTQAAAHAVVPGSQAVGGQGPPSAEGWLKGAKRLDSWQAFDSDSGDVAEETTEMYRRNNVSFKERGKKKQAGEQ